jgi:hypothetical protein
MKIITTLLIVLTFWSVSSCKKYTNCGFGEEQTGITGKWRLVEELMDPGDGSGTFQPVTSNKEIVFNSNGTFEANGEMCAMSSQSGSVHAGTYDSTTETFTPANCASIGAMPFHYSVNGNTLILSYPCICGCLQKYQRIQ